jgi:hypothetical protein
VSDARTYILSLRPGTRHLEDWERAADLLLVIEAIELSTDAA